MLRGCGLQEGLGVRLRRGLFHAVPRGFVALGWAPCCLEPPVPGQPAHRRVAGAATLGAASMLGRAPGAQGAPSFRLSPSLAGRRRVAEAQRLLHQTAGLAATQQ